MELIQWKIEGMDCSSCAITIRRYLEKEGMKEVKVNFATGDVSFGVNGTAATAKLTRGIESLGYKVAGEQQGSSTRKPLFSTHLQRFLFCFPFMALLLIHMIGLHIEWLMDPWVQMILTLPVYIVGMSFFGRSAWKSLRNRMPNMNLLITVGATASFFYSLYGTFTGDAVHYMFYETTVTIITLVFFGNYLEDASVQSTQRALQSLSKSQKVMANMIVYDDQHREHIYPVENGALHVGDLVLIRSGEQVPADCKVLWGDAQVNEAILTGESMPVQKNQKDKLIGGSIIQDGTIKAQVTAVGPDTVLAGIIHLVKQAQGEKPPVQELADKISAIFIPVVLGIALVTLFVNWLVLKDFSPALMRSIAVLVIACPCAMGLATPAAIAVGLGRAARSGILFRNATSLELFKDLRQVVFDKTGTLTTGQFSIREFHCLSGSEEEFRKIAFSLEKYSNHPMAKSIVRAWKGDGEIRWTRIEEIKGLGMKAVDKDGNIWQAGSYKIAALIPSDIHHNIYVMRNNELLGWIDMMDEVRPEAGAVVKYLQSKGIKTILLSGDRLENCRSLASSLGIDEVIAEQSPEQKLSTIAELTAKYPTAMVGDGINDAPALARATVGISMSDASHLALQSAQVVLMDKGLKHLPTALGLGKHTYITIRQNLLWAFAYNVVALPVAALGWLTPSFGALVMGLSDVVLAINSGRLFVKKVE